MEYMLNIGGRREDLEIKNFHIIKIVLERQPYSNIYFILDLNLIWWWCWRLTHNVDVGIGDGPWFFATDL